jgi:hypothetical protein
MTEIQDGMKQIKQMIPEDDSFLSEPEKDSIVAKMIRLAAKSIIRFQQNTFLILDAYFTSNVAFEVDCLHYPAAVWNRFSEWL